MNLDTETKASNEDIEDIMAYHEWSEEQIETGVMIRKKLGEALKLIIDNVPPSPDRSTAIRKIREARMDCNSAITHHGKY